MRFHSTHSSLIVHPLISSQVPELKSKSAECDNYLLLGLPRLGRP